jgi:hypothetical protein
LNEEWITTVGRARKMTEEDPGVQMAQYKIHNMHFLGNRRGKIHISVKLTTL